MCVALAAAALTAGAGITSSISQYQQGISQDRYYQSLAERSRAEAAYATKMGDVQSTAIQDTAKVEGKQLKEGQAEFNASTRAQLAANGISGVTAEDIVSSNLSKERMDELVLRNKADVNSWQANTQAGYENYAKNAEANDYGFAGKSAKRAGKISAFTTLLGTAASVASMAPLGSGKRLLATQTQSFGGGVKPYRKPIF